MNFKNLAMWAVIILLSVGLFNMFQSPENLAKNNNQISFHSFLKKLMTEGLFKLKLKEIILKEFFLTEITPKTYSPNYPDLVEKLSEKGVSIIASPLEDKMPSLFGILLSWFPMLLLIGVWIFFMRQIQGGKGGAMGFGRSKAKLLNEAQGKVTFNDVAGVEEAKEKK